MDPDVVEAVTIAAAAVAGGVSTIAARVVATRRKAKKAPSVTPAVETAPKPMGEPVVGYSKRALKRGER